MAIVSAWRARCSSVTSPSASAKPGAIAAAPSTCGVQNAIASPVSLNVAVSALIASPSPLQLIPNSAALSLAVAKCDIKACRPIETAVKPMPTPRLIRVV